jgi:hypothetical protein
LRRVQGPTDHGCFEGTGIYRQVAKGFGLGYGDDSIEYKDDPVYIESSGRFTQVRYGLYASAEDTARDASVWQSRYSVTPWVISVPLSEALVGNVLWGALPGVYTPPT